MGAVLTDHEIGYRGRWIRNFAHSFLVTVSWKPALAVDASRETLIKGTHNKSINQTVVWRYSIVTGIRRGRRSLKRRIDER